MAIVVRRLRDGEAETYLEIVNRAIRGLSGGPYDPHHLAGWIVPIDERTLAEFAANDEGEIRLLAELDGTPAGIGALVIASSELRACYVVPEASGRGCGAAIVREIERLAREHHLTRLTLSASLNAEAFYARLGYAAHRRGDIVLRNGHRMPAVAMARDL